MHELPETGEILALIRDEKISEAEARIEKLRASALSARAESAELKGRVRDLEQSLERQGVIEYDGRFYWRRPSGEGAKRDGPFCQFCYDKTGRTMRLIAENDGIRYCAECGTAYPPTKR